MLFAKRSSFLILLLLLHSCGGNPFSKSSGHDSSEELIEAESYSYELREKDCSTGPHSFETFNETCRALKNDELNNGCAKKERDDLFKKSECSGQE